MVVGIAILNILIRNIRIEDGFDPALNEILDMTVSQLSRIAYRFRRDSLHTAFVDLMR